MAVCRKESLYGNLTAVKGRRNTVWPSQIGNLAGRLALLLHLAATGQGRKAAEKHGKSAAPVLPRGLNSFKLANLARLYFAA